MPEQHVLDYLPAYVMGCMDETESQKVKAHLRECDHCRKGMRAYKRVLDDLPLRIALSEPPPGTREQILYRASKLLEPSISNNLILKRVPRTHSLFQIGLLLNLLLIVISTISSLVLWRRLTTIENQVFN